MAVTTYTSTKETTNYARLSRLIVDVCADLLRKLLQHRLPINQFKAILPNIKSKIFKNLNSKQQEILYPRRKTFGGSYDDFDISLLYTLLRNVGNLPQPSNGWGTAPSLDDRSLSANIERIRMIKNDSYSHLLKASISDSSFNSIWLEISQTVEDIETTVFAGSTDFKNAIEDLKSDPLDPELEILYIEKLSQLREEEGEMKCDLKEMKGKIYEIAETNAYMMKQLKTGMPAVRDDHMSPLQRNIKDNSEAMINTHRNDKTFVQTKSIDIALNILSKFGIVIYKGTSGTGKTTNAKEIMKLKKEMNPDCILVALDDVRKWDEVINAKWNMVVLLDDFLGQNNELFEVKNNSFWWEKIYSCIKHGKVQVVMTSCSNIFNRCWRQLQKCNLFKDEYIVDLSSEDLKLTVEEKTEILRRHCKANNILFCKTPEEENFTSDAILDPKVSVYISEEKLQAMANSDPVIGFLQACFLFSTDRRNTQLGVIFINHAAQILVTEFNDWSISGLRTDKVHYCMFVFMLLKNGRMELDQVDRHLLNRLSDFVGLSTEIHPTELKQGMEALKDKYVIQNGTADSYIFKHQSIREAVINSFGKSNPRLLLELCNLNLINEIIRTENYVPKCGDTVLHIQPKLYSTLVKRFFQDGALSLCIPHQAMEDEEFLQCFMETVLGSKDYRMRVAKSCRNDFGIFVWACMYGRTRFIEMLWQHCSPSTMESGILRFTCIGMANNCRSQTDEFRLSLHILCEGLNWACREGKMETVEWLMDHVKQFEQEHIGNAFICSCRENRLDVVKYIFENKKFRLEFEHVMDGLRQSCINGHQNVFEYIVNTKKDVKFEHLSEAFSISCAADQSSMVDLLLNISQQKNFSQPLQVAQNRERITNLHVAAFIGNYSLFMKLLELDLSTSHRTSQGISVLQSAILGYKQSGMLCMAMSEFSKQKVPLISKYCTKRRNQKFGSLSDYQRIIECLLERDDTTLSDLDFYVDNMGNTLAHYCVIHNSVSLVHALYQKYRILFSVPNKHGILPIEFGLFLGRKDICKVLFSIGQNTEKPKTFKGLLLEGRKHHRRSYSWDDLKKPGILHHVEEKHNNVVFGTENDYDSITQVQFLNPDSD